MKLVSKILIILIILLSLSNIISFAYEDALFKFNVPENYTNMSTTEKYVFQDSENEERKMEIYALEFQQVGNSIDDISDNKLNEIVSKFGNSMNFLEANRKDTLGDLKVIRVLLKETEGIKELNIFVHNKVVYVMVFDGKTREELNNSDYNMIRDSFEINRDEQITLINKVFKIIGILILIRIVIGFIPSRDMKSHYKNYKKSKKIDYKNLSEQDLNNFKYKK